MHWVSPDFAANRGQTLFRLSELNWTEPSTETQTESVLEPTNSPALSLSLLLLSALRQVDLGLSDTLWPWIPKKR